MRLKVIFIVPHNKIKKGRKHKSNTYIWFARIDVHPFIHDFKEFDTFHQISYNEFKTIMGFAGGCVNVAEKLNEILKAIYAAEDASTKKIKEAKEKSQNKIEKLIEELKAEREEYTKSLERHIHEIIEKKKSWLLFTKSLL